MTVSNYSKMNLEAIFADPNVDREIVDILDFVDGPGNKYFVDSATGASGNSGGNWDEALATIDQGIAKCTANNGDFVYVAPNHAENVTAADGIDADIAGVTVVGLGTGLQRPTVSFTAAAGSVTVAAADFTMKNILFIANFATGTTTGFTITAAGDGCTLDSIEMRDTSAANEFLVHASVATTVADLTVKNCKFIGAAGTMSGSFVFAGTSTNLDMHNNYWRVDSSDSVIHHDTGAATNALLHHNTIINIDTNTAEYCAEFKTASTGCAHDNRFGYNKNDAEVSKGDAMFWFENYASNTIAESGLLDPVTTHAIP